jgi:hypothetical protein
MTTAELVEAERLAWGFYLESCDETDAADNPEHKDAALKREEELSKVWKAVSQAAYVKKGL